MAAVDIETLGTAVRRHALLAPDHPAFRLDGQVLSYAELDRAASCVAAALERDHIAAGDVIAALGTTSLPYLTLMIGAARAGVVLAVVPTTASEPAIQGMLADVGYRALFSDQTISLPDDIASGAHVDLGEAAFERWLAPADPVRDQAPVRCGDAATIIYSSGTTGTPKGIVQPYRNCSELIRTAPSRGFDATSVTLLATPLYSNTTLSSLYSTLGAGGTVVLMKKFDPGAWLALAQQVAATNISMVPIMYQRILAHPDFARADLSSFRMKSCSGAPLSVALKRELLDRWPGGLNEIYGLSESGVLTVLRAHEHPDKLHTVGQLASGCEMRVLDEAYRDVASGTPGELVSRSPGAMIGYHNRDADTTASYWTDAQGREWLRTGDIGQFDAQGFLTIVGRKKDVIISGGFNIYPSDIEAELAGHPQVREASVVGVPSTTWGETPVAFVVADDESAAAIKDWINARVGKMQRVADVVLVDALPRNPLGKVQKNELRDLYAARP